MSDKPEGRITDEEHRERRNDTFETCHVLWQTIQRQLTRPLKVPDMPGEILSTLRYVSAAVDRIQPEALAARGSPLHPEADLLPLATMYSLVKQMMMLNVVQEDFERDLAAWRERARTLSEPALHAMRLVHGFVCFALAVNYVHPYDTLTRATIRMATVNVRRLGMEEAIFAVDRLIAAYTVGMEHWKRASGQYTGNEVLAPVFDFSPQTHATLERWYNAQRVPSATVPGPASAPPGAGTKVAFDKVMAWYRASHSRIVPKEPAEVSPLLKSIVGHYFPRYRSDEHPYVPPEQPHDHSDPGMHPAQPAGRNRTSRFPVVRNNGHSTQGGEQPQEPGDESDGDQDMTLWSSDADVWEGEEEEYLSDQSDGVFYA